VSVGRFVRLWVPLLTYMALIFYISSLHEAPLPEGISDKSGHSFGYLGLGVVAARAVAGGLPARITRRIAAIALAIAVGYGATDEVHQMFVAGRSAEWYDLGADAIGACIGVALCWGWGIISLRSGPNGASRHDF
jgi:hypothetical protein